VIESADNVPYAGLLPETVLQLAEAAGLHPDGRLFALNSYENRVYRLGCDDGNPVVLKFYRAGRWSDAQILEEHAFATELAAAEIPVVAPLELRGHTLYQARGFRMAAFPLRSGAAPELEAPGARALLGRSLARIHACGARRDFRHRWTLGGELLGARAPASGAQVSALAAGALRVTLPEPELDADRCDPRAMAPRFGQRLIRLHGDCHLGNILWNQTGPVFVDLDDCLSGPAIQDLWMFLSGSADEQRFQWSELIDGYEQFASFDYGQLQLMEALRAVRMLNHTAWIAERWADPAFPRAFPVVRGARLLGAAPE
jgi:Ser/Thr protein kinase RdoA (MazF antagonist)